GGTPVLSGLARDDQRKQYPANDLGNPKPNCQGQYPTPGFEYTRSRYRSGEERNPKTPEVDLHARNPLRISSDSCLYPNGMKSVKLGADRAVFPGPCLAIAALYCYDENETYDSRQNASSLPAGRTPHGF